MLKGLILKNRSYRRFFQSYVIGEDILKELINYARLTPSSANLQPLKYIISCDPKKNSLIFPYLEWGGYLKEWEGPVEGERPSAYVIILGDTEISQKFEYDCGIAAQTILLAATEKNLGGCMIASIDRKALRNALNIPNQYKILLVLALGKPKEKVVIEPLGKDQDIRYWRDKKEIHHVPKRGLDDILLSL